MKHKINVDEFLKFGPESSYILGLMWADGTISKYGVSITGVKEDLILNKRLFEIFGSWGYYYRDTWLDKDVNRKEQMSVHIGEKMLIDRLKTYGYDSKIIPRFILDLIPKENLKYWWRGYVDGDGCFYFNLNQRHKDFFFTSYYDQDWSFVESLFNLLDIKYRIVKRHGKMNNGRSSSSSRIIIKGDDGVLKFGEFLYNDYENDKIGYVRKYEKYKLIFNWKITEKYLKRDNVYKSKERWTGTFNYCGTTYYCGNFENKEDAILAVKQKKNQIIFTK